MLPLVGAQQPYGAGMSVNHPYFVLNYVRIALPELMQLADTDWAEPYKQDSLRQYLKAHQTPLQRMGLREPNAEIFVANSA